MLWRIFVYKYARNMTRFSNINQLLLFVGVLVVMILLVFRGGPKQVYLKSPVKTIETRIEGKEKLIKTVEVRIGNEKSIVAKITMQIDSLRAELQSIKQKKDTFQIVQIQDTLIFALTKENIHLKSIVNGQDSIIVAQRYIINSKDTIITYQNTVIAGNKKDIKRVKWQRNISIGLNAVLTGVAIFKK